MKNRIFARRSLSFALIGCMLFLSIGASSLPVEQVQAERVLLSAEGRDISRLTLESIPDSLSQTLGLDSAEEQTQAVSLDVTDADSLNSFTTIHEDGSRSVYAFAQPVKYWDAETNRIEFIDNDWQQTGLLDSLFSDVAYTNRAGSVKVAMPKDIRSGISVEWRAEEMEGEEALSPSEGVEEVAASGKEDYTFRMTPVADLSARAVQEDGSPYVQYEAPFGEGTRLEYKAITHGVKENLVLECEPGVNEFAFDIEAPGLVPNVTQGSTIEFYDEQTGELAVTLTQPWAMDSAAEQEPVDASSALEEEISVEPIPSEEETSSEIAVSQQEASRELAAENETQAAPTVETQPENQGANLCFDMGYRIEPTSEGKYRLVMYIDKEFLESPSTVYPVTIDPTIFTYANDIPYVALFSNGNRWTQLGCVGNASGAEALMYFKVPNMGQYKHINPNKVVSASVFMRQDVGSETEYYVDLHDSNTSVSIESATYSTVLSGLGTRMVSVKCGVNNKVYSWDFKDLFKAWLNYELTGTGWPSYQFIIKARSTGLECKYFDTSNIVSESFYYKINYNEDTSIPSGTYFIRGVKDGKYLDHVVDDNRTTVWDFDGTSKQQWKVTKNSDGTYSIKPMDNTSLGLEVYYDSDTNQQPITQYTYDSTIKYKWRIIENSDGTYRIMPAMSKDKGLDVHNGTDTTMTFNGRSFPKRDGIDVQLYDYTGGSHRKWEFVPVNGYNVYSASHVVQQVGVLEYARIPVNQTVTIYRNGNTIYQLKHAASARQCNETEFILGSNIITLQHTYFDVYGEIRHDGVYTAQNSTVLHEEYAYFTGVLEDSFTCQNGTISVRGTAKTSALDSATPGFFTLNITESQLRPLD